MSDTIAHDYADLRHGDNKQPPSNQQYAQKSASQVSDANPSIESAPVNSSRQTRDLVNSLTKAMKRPADGKCFSCLCKNGVLRILYFLPAPLDEPTSIAGYNAKPLSPELLKAYLDYKMEWSQEVEDRFRGVDGTSVPQEHWLHPPPGAIEYRGSKNERTEEIKTYNDKVRQGEGSSEVAGPVCGGIPSNFDLRPR
ncbi:hypothetical protein T440DRAFT_437050 [Plenodomus tracheiphilus IPT5]|uniref:Uncharacterized protein n=1 Tax=Plenodomus tracheiphilus IPT5 TaxID=1408161 RepID=A0A6A7ALH4_9PLEO|nr:hypothetical protein T440DRAFT_437050 [Plenodomus tracheiphilus IPT5]